MTKTMNGWREYADKLADKLMDAGNITFAALIVGQLISGRPFNWGIAALGAVAWVGFYFWAWAVLQWRRGE
jgi:hypothetical protein